MAKPGRPSADDLAAAGSVLNLFQRPDPPADLTTEQADEWRAVVARLPADWFTRETHGNLIQFCRHVVTARRISQLITSDERQPLVDVDRLDQLLRMQERESRAIAALARSMRLTQQSNYSAKSAATGKRQPGVGNEPWR